MDAFNRGIIVILAAIWVILMAVVIFVTWAADTETIDRLGDLVQYLDDHTDNTSKLILTLGALALIVFCLIVIVAEVVPAGPSADIHLEGVTGATAILPAEAINQRIEQEVTALTQVKEAKATVTARDRGLAVALNLVLDPDANVVEVTEQACRITQETIEQKIGVALVGLPTVQIAFSPPEGEPAPAPEGEQEAPEPPLS
ncbi:MAG: hypothetical protein ACUVV3_01025 [Dehalococcoidia bacterium]